MEASAAAANGPSGPNTVAKVLRLRRQTPPILEQYVIRGNILEENADVEFHCADGVVKAHKVILSLVSNFFSNLFRCQAEEAVVMVPDIKMAVMKAIVNLCYKRDITLESAIVPQVAQWLSDFGLRLQDFTFGTREGFAQQKTPERAQAQPLKKVIKSEPIVPPSPSSVTDESMNETTQEPEPHVDGNNCRQVETPAAHCPTFWLDLESFGQEPAHNSPQIPFAPAQAVQRTLNPPGNTKKLIPVVPATPRKTQQDVLAQKIWTENVSRTPSNLPPVLKPEARTFAITHRPPGTPAPRILKGNDQKADKTCQVCKCAFSNETQWKWHTERHLSNGLFKCTVCRRTFNSSRNVYQHEMSVHKAGGLPVAGSSAPSTHQAESAEEEEAEEPASNENIKRKTLLTFHRSKYRHRLHQRVAPLKLKALASHANVAGKRGRRPKWSVSKVPSPDIAPAPRKDTTKIRWVYICKKCKHSSDSSIKAFAHFVQCSPNSDQKYEDTVDKCRQGHYGDYECPICTRQYSTMQGFVVHCMHTHKDYRKSFSHIINDDKLLCIHCGGTFPNPQEFHNHLNPDTYLCEQPNKLVAKPVKKFQSKITTSKDPAKLLQPRIYLNDVLEKMPSESHNDMPAPPTPDSASKRIKRKSSQTETSDDPRKELFKKMLSTNPKSARLQNRLAAVTSEGKADQDQPTELTCAICGLSVNDLKLHLDTDHGDLDMDIEIVEDSIFRCNYCSISFASCDLLAHHRSCEANKVPDPVQVPSHVGVSPVDQIGTNDLMAIETIKNALQCPVCKLEAKKLNMISECLRNHGIFRCSLCFNTYSSKEDQTKHMKSCHMNSNFQMICPICQSVRSNIGQVTSHVYASHWSNFFKKYDKNGKAPPRPENDFSLEISPAKEKGQRDPLEGSN